MKKIRLLSLLAIVVATFYVTPSYSQADASNNIVVSVTSAINFNLNTATLIENAQTLSNVLTIKVKTGRTTCHIYAAIPSGITTTSGTPMPVGNLMLTFKSTTCTASFKGTITSGDIAMTTSNQVLFTQLKTSTQFSYVYDVKIPAIGYTYAPGTYNYTVQFTMTQP